MSGVDIEALYAALDAARAARGIAWCDVAQQTGVSPSTLTRIGRGRRPDVDGFAALVQWLGIPAEAFMSPGRALAPDLEAQIAVVLSSDPGLWPEDRRMLFDVLAAAVRYVRTLHAEI